jgi:hypothetical protein
MGVGDGQDVARVARESVDQARQVRVAGGQQPAHGGVAPEITTPATIATVVKLAGAQIQRRVEVGEEVAQMAADEHVLAVAAQHGIVIVAAVEVVGVVAAFQRITPPAAPGPVQPAVAADQVISRIAQQLVIAGMPEHRVVAGVTLQRIDSIAAAQQVRAEPALEQVIAVVAPDEVAARTAVQLVIAAFAAQAVVAALADDRVVALASEDQVVPDAPLDQVVARAGKNLGRRDNAGGHLHAVVASEDQDADGGETGKIVLGPSAVHRDEERLPLDLDVHDICGFSAGDDKDLSFEADRKQAARFERLDRKSGQGANQRAPGGCGEGDRWTHDRSREKGRALWQITTRGTDGNQQFRVVDDGIRRRSRENRGSGV